MSYLINGIRGFFMALADSVPGVSGGTIAFILGFYDKFINSLDGLFYGDKKAKINSLKFLIKLGIGWGIGMIIASLVLTKLFETKIYAVSSVFLGFIIFSIPVIVISEKNSFKGNYKNIFFGIFGILLVLLVSFLNTKVNGNFDINNLNFGSVIYVFVAGMVAISAMVLPGISGSTMLLIFGLYIPVITSVRALLKFDFSNLPVLIILILGVVVGIASVIKLVKVCLDKKRSATMYFVLGLMIGSLYAIVMGPTTLDVPKDPMTFETFSIVFFIVGGIIILGLEKLNSILLKQKEKYDM